MGIKKFAVCVFVAFLTCNCATQKLTENAYSVLPPDMMFSQDSTQDSIQSKVLYSYVPEDYIRRYEISHGLLMGTIGFFSGAYFFAPMAANVPIGGDCFDCDVGGLFWIGGAVGLVSGFVLGRHAGRKIARKKYLTENPPNN